MEDRILDNTAEYTGISKWRTADAKHVTHLTIWLVLHTQLLRSLYLKQMHTRPVQHIRLPWKRRVL